MQLLEIVGFMTRVEDRQQRADSVTSHRRNQGWDVLLSLYHFQTTHTLGGMPINQIAQSLD